MSTITLKHGEKVLAVVPEFASGPGWSNRPIWVYIGNYAGNTFRAECIQPEKQTAEMHALFSIGAAAHSALLASVKTRKARK